jgi:hypothetical protein
MSITKNQKILIGVGALAGLLFLSQGDDQAYAGGTGGFGGGFGGDGSIGETGVAGVSDSGTPYQFNFPTPDTSWVSSFMAPSPDRASVVESSQVVTPKKESAAITSGGTSGGSGTGLTASLSQVFGSPAQQRDARGDPFTSPSGGGSGAIVGESLGTKFIAGVKNALAAEKDPANRTPTGASTSLSSPVVSVPKKIASAQAAANIAEAGYGKSLLPTPKSKSSGSSPVVKKVAAEPTKKSWTLAEVKAGKNRR